MSTAILYPSWIYTHGLGRRPDEQTVLVENRNCVLKRTDQRYRSEPERLPAGSGGQAHWEFPMVSFRRPACRFPPDGLLNAYTFLQAVLF